jgi:Zn-dependent protease
MSLVLSLTIFLFAIIIHEISHGWVAYKLGDPTAKYAGRLTLNPMAHIDPFGMILLPLILTMMGSPVIFGWAKPVPVNFWNLKNPRRDMIWVGLAGPIANIILAFALSLFLKININLPALIFNILIAGIYVNLVLAVFNLIPIPPLDGSRVVVGLLPRELAVRYIRLERFGIPLIFLLMFMGLFNYLIRPIVQILANLLGVPIYL